MIDAVDQRLKSWIGQLAGPAEVLLAHPGEMPGKEGVSLYLLEVGTNPPLRGANRPPLCLSLRYLLTTWFADSNQAHRLLADLAFAAMAEKDIELEPTTFPLEHWRQFGVPPRPSLLLRAIVKKSQPERRGPYVRSVNVRFGAMRPLQGQIVGPGGIPIMAAAVRLPALRLSTKTDHEGRFCFPGAPGDLPVKAIQVNARGREITWPVPADAGDQPLLIKLNNDQI